MGYNMFQALGDMAKSGGSYYSVLAQEQMRGKRLAEARESEESRYQRGRADKAADTEAAQTYNQQQAAAKLIQDEKTLTKNNIIAREQASLVRGDVTKHKEDNPTIQKTLTGVDPVTNETTHHSMDSNGKVESLGLEAAHNLNDNNGANFKAQTQIRKEVSGVMDKSKLEDISVGLEKMVSAYKGENSITDAAMIFYFMKTLDPESVVRESEFRTIEQARAFIAENPSTGLKIPAGLQQYIQKWTGKGNLLQEQRDQMLDESINAYNSTLKRTDRALDNYKAITAKNGWDEVDVGLTRFDYKPTSRKILFNDKSDDAGNSPTNNVPKDLQAIYDELGI